MAEFTYRSTIHGPRTFYVDDAGGVVVYKGKQLSEFGGYLSPGGRQRPLLANAKTLEAVARHWWKRRTAYLFSMGDKANGIDP